MGHTEIDQETGLELLGACKAWMRVESEMRENTPCPDLALRATYRKEAIRLTRKAIAKAEGEKNETETQPPGV